MQCAHERVRGLPGTLGRISPLIRATVDGLDTATLTLAPKTGDQSGGLAGLALDAGPGPSRVRGARSAATMGQR